MSLQRVQSASNIQIGFSHNALPLFSSTTFKNSFGMEETKITGCAVSEETAMALEDPWKLFTNSDHQEQQLDTVPECGPIWGWLSAVSLSDTRSTDVAPGSPPELAVAAEDLCTRFIPYGSRDFSTPSPPGENIDVVYPVPLSQRNMQTLNATTDRGVQTSDVKVDSETPMLRRLVSLAYSTMHTCLNIHSSSSYEAVEESSEEEAEIPAAKDWKKHCPMRFLHCLEDYFGYDSQGEWKCCKFWLAIKAISEGIHDSSKIRIFECLDPNTKTVYGGAVTCLLDTGCTTAGIIRDETVMKLGWSPVPFEAQSKTVKTGSGHELKTIGMWRLYMRCSETGVRIDVPLDVVRKADFPEAECVLGSVVVERKHFECPRQYCMTRYLARQFG